ncbi:MAG: DNA methyltransferase [bacterium]
MPVINNSIIIKIKGTRGKIVPAPRNRTTFLTEQDIKQFNNFFTLPAGNDKVCLDSITNRIILGDSLAGMKRVPSRCIDLIFADPPYNMGKDFGNSSDKRSKKEYLNWTDTWLKQARRILKNTGSIYVCCDWEYSGKIQQIMEKYFLIKNRITWRREKGRGARTNWKSNMEDIWFAVAGKDYTFNIEEVKIKKEVLAPYRFGGKGGPPKDWVEENGERYRYTCPSNIWQDMVVPFWSMPENTPHPTQKPEKLLERIIMASSNKGDLILDPFLGSGTTAVVAKKLGRNYIAFEINKDYIRLTMKRLNRIT